MSEIRFDDGAAYEEYMGRWSQLVGEVFLEWLAVPPGLRWLDVGCGNGAFTAQIVTRCAPAFVTGIDPSEAQLVYARARPGLQQARFERGDAMSLPLDAASVDVAVMPLVLFFVPEPARGVQEMARVAAAGGTVAAYSWDMDGGGFPYAVLRSELEGMGLRAPAAPSEDASRLDVSRRLWEGAGLRAVETRSITVERTFADFDTYWSILQQGPSVGGTLRALSTAQATTLRERLRARFPPDAAGRISYRSRANAVKGRVL